MWQKVIDHFQTLEHRPLERLVLLVSGMLLLWLIEGAIPLLSLQYKKNKLRHAYINMSFTLMHLLIHTGFAVFIVLLSDYCKQQNLGLVHWLNASVAATILIAFLVLSSAPASTSIRSPGFACTCAAMAFRRSSL